jgi:hypothetical protein
MSERQVNFAQWEGKYVKVTPSSIDDFSDKGQIEEVTEWGLILRLQRRISWGEGRQDSRMVSEFRPWDSITAVRVLEPEEREEREERDDIAG